MTPIPGRDLLVPTARHFVQPRLASEFEAAALELGVDLDLHVFEGADHERLEEELSAD